MIRSAAPSAATCCAAASVTAGGPTNDAAPGLQPGTVDLLRDGQKVDVAKLNAGERFAFHVRPGKCTLSTDLGFKCGRDVQVDDRVVEADLECSIK